MNKIEVLSLKDFFKNKKLKSRLKTHSFHFNDANSGEKKQRNAASAAASCPFQLHIGKIIRSKTSCFLSL